MATLTHGRNPARKTTDGSFYRCINDLDRNAQPEHALVEGSEPDGADVMDRYIVEHNLRLACDRLAACQESLLLQRLQVRELERSGLDATLARNLLHIYEDARDLAVSHRESLAQAVRAGHYLTAAGAAPTSNDDDDFDYLLAA
jgi:hypothetical protein